MLVVGSEVQDPWQLAPGSQLGSRAKRGYKSSWPLCATYSTALELSYRAWFSTEA